MYTSNERLIDLFGFMLALRAKKFKANLTDIFMLDGGGLDSVVVIATG